MLYLFKKGTITMQIKGKVAAIFFISAALCIPFIGENVISVNAADTTSSAVSESTTELANLKFYTSSDQRLILATKNNVFDSAGKTRTVNIQAGTQIQFSPTSNDSSALYRYGYKDAKHTSQIYLQDYSKNGNLILRPTLKGTTTIVLERKTGNTVEKETFKINVTENSSYTNTVDSYAYGDSLTLNINADKTLWMKKGTFQFIKSWNEDILSAKKLSTNLFYVKALKAGSTQLMTISANGDVQFVDVKVNNSAASSTTTFDLSALSKIKPSICIGQTYQLSYASGVTYKSADTKIAKVDSKGKITAVASGKTNITVTYNKKSTTVAVTVKSGYSLEKTAFELNVNGTAQIKPKSTVSKSYTYTSSNTAVATVSSAGVIKGVKAGTAKITVKNNLGETKTASVNVNTTSIKLNTSSQTLVKGKTYQLKATLDSGSPTKYTFSTSNSSVATVNSSTGLVTAKAAGTATITVKTTNNKTATCKITVTATTVPSNVTVKFGSVIPTVHVGKTVKVNVTASNSSYTNNITCTSSNTKIATVSFSKGVCTVKGVGTGKVTITAALPNGKKATSFVYSIGNYNDFRTETAVEKGIDVSTWNTNIDYKALKKAGYTFVIIRSGYGGVITQKDNQFETHIQGAKAAGLGIGIYHFSYAVNAAAAKQEAKICNQIISKYRSDITHGVYFDYEDDSVRYAKQQGYTVNKTNVTAITKAFCSEMENYGFVAGVYSNTSYTNMYLDLSQLSNYLFWYAAPGATVFPFDFDIWQYSFTARPSGTNGDTDGDKVFTTIFQKLK